MSINLSKELSYEDALQYVKESYPEVQVYIQFEEYDKALKLMNKDINTWCNGKALRTYWKECNKKVIDTIKQSKIS